MEFEAPSVWRIASKHTVTFHNLAALGLKRLAAILVDLAEVDAETPMGTRRRLGQSLEKPWLSGAELKVRIQLPPAVSQQTFGSSKDAPVVKAGPKGRLSPRAAVNVSTSEAYPRWGSRFGADSHPGSNAA